MNVLEQVQDTRGLAEAPITVEKVAPATSPQPTFTTPLLAPHPPSDEELYTYFGAQKRWVLVAMNIAALIAMATLTAFALKSWIFYPLLITIALGVVGTIISLITSVHRRRLTREGHIQLVADYQPVEWPSVDVFLPTCGEPIHILLNTYRRVAEIDWPGELRPVVLDDADRPEVAAAAESFGFRYIVRPNRGYMKKAGNLAYAYGVTQGDVILLLDADFAPRADVLRHLMPYMADQSVGIVQSPQVFDTSASMGWVERGAGATQELFYRFIQPSRDALGAAICVGTSALYKREALQANGGFADIDHSEDIYTGLQLQSHGYQLQYVPVLVSKGLSPHTIASYINQQYRWCLGSMSLLGSKSFHNLKMTAKQRLAHWAGFLFYITTAIGSIFMELPGLLALLLFASTIEPWFYLGLLPAVWVKAVLIPMTYRSSIRLEVQRVEMVFGFAHLYAAIDAMRGKAAAWVPTSAVPVAPAKSRGGMPLSRKVAITAVLFNTGLLAAMVFAIWRGVAENGLSTLWMSALLIVLFAYVAIPVVWQLIPVAIPALASASVFEKTNGARRVPAGALESPMNHPMAWPEASAITAFIVCIGIAAVSYV